jgi:gas vesicle protein
VAEQGKGFSFGSGFLLGAVVGTILGLLFAPQTGRQTREMLRARGDELAAKAKETLREAWLQGKETATKVGAELRERLEQARKKETE